jgi:hypothetical protein
MLPSILEIGETRHPPFAPCCLAWRTTSDLFMLILLCKGRQITRPHRHPIEQVPEE